MNILLLNSCFVSKRKDYMQRTASHLRVGVASMAAVLEGEGIKVSIIDPYVEHLTLDEVTQKVISQSPDYVGFSAFTEEIVDAAAIAKRVKELMPNCITIVGGCHVSAIPVDTLKEFNSFDIAVAGEGERTLTNVVQGINFEKIHGIVYRNKKKEIIYNPPSEDVLSVDKLPYPAWHLYNLDHYDLVPVETIRGCPFSCVFCFRAVGRKVRYRSPERIVDEIEWVVRKYGHTYFALTGGGTFPLDKEHGLEVCHKIIKRSLNIKWVTGTRVNIVDEELLTAMKKSGCDAISLGIESGDPEVLKLSGKGTTSEDQEKAVKLCKKVGINADLGFILGLPGENEDSLSNTFNFAMKMRKYSSLVNFAILTPFPGTEVYDMARENQNGLKMISKDWTDFCKQSGLAIQHENFAKGELLRYQTKYYLSYYLRSPLKALRIFSFQRAFAFWTRIFISIFTKIREQFRL